MKKPEVIASDFASRANDFYHEGNWFNYAQIMRNVFAGHSTYYGDGDDEAYKLNLKHNVATSSMRNVSVAPAIIKAVVGNLLQNEKQFVAYSTDANAKQQEEAMNKGLKYCNAETHRKSVKMQQTIEAAVTGIGGAVASLDFTREDAPAGAPVLEFKRNIMFDNNMDGVFDSNRISWCGYSESMNRADLLEYIDNIDKKDYIGIHSGYDINNQLLSNTNNNYKDNTDFLHVYFWFEYITVYDVDNPFVASPDDFAEIANNHPEAANLIADVATKLKINYEQQSFVLKKEELKEFESAIENIETLTGIEIELKKYPRQCKQHYKAEFGDNKLLTAGEAFTSQCHPMSFVVCEYDSFLGEPIGLMRTLAKYQFMLNEAVTVMMKYAKDAPKGGAGLATGFGDDAETFKQFKSALNNDVESAYNVIFGDEKANFRGLATVDAFAASSGVVEYITRQMFASIGMQAGLFESLISNNKTATEIRDNQEKITAALGSFAANLDKSTLLDGFILRDLVYEIASNVQDAKQVTFVLGGKEGSFALGRQDLSRGYSMRLVERDLTRDEQMEDFIAIENLISKTVTDPMQLAKVAPILIELHPAKLENKEKLLQALQPAPPNPQMEQLAMQNQMLDLRIKQSTATAQEAMAMEAQANAKAKVEQIQVDIAKKASEIEKNDATTEKTNVDAAVAAMELVSGYEPKEYN